MLLGSRFDFDLCIRSEETTGLCDRGLLNDKLPVDVAPFSRLTSGFSIGHGRGIFETHGVSGEGGHPRSVRGGRADHRGQRRSGDDSGGDLVDVLVALVTEVQAQGWSLFDLWC